MKLPAMEKGQSKIGPNAFNVDFRINTKNDKQASTEGTLVKNQFFLRVKPKVSGCVYGGQPENLIPITIFNNPKNVQDENSPQNFRP